MLKKRKKWLVKTDPGYEAFVEELKQIISEGYSMKEVAEMYGTAKKAVTKNAVAGCTHRNNISFGIKDPKKAESKEKTAHSGTKKLVRPSKGQDNVLVFHPPPLVPILETNRCQWPIGELEADDFRWCQEEKWETYPYCQTHRAMAYVPTPKTKSKA